MVKVGFRWMTPGRYENMNASTQKNSNQMCYLTKILFCLPSSGYIALIYKINVSLSKRIFFDFSYCKEGTEVETNLSILSKNLPECVKIIVMLNFERQSSNVTILWSNNTFCGVSPFFYASPFSIYLPPYLHPSVTPVSPVSTV